MATDMPAKANREKHNSTVIVPINPLHVKGMKIQYR
jgi:hypothetical protein